MPAPISSSAGARSKSSTLKFRAGERDRAGEAGDARAGDRDPHRGQAAGR